MGQAHTAGDILEMRRGPEQRCTGCRGGCRERAAQPRHRRSRAPRSRHRAPARPAPPHPCGSCSAETTVTSPCWAARG